MKECSAGKLLFFCEKVVRAKQPIITKVQSDNGNNKLTPSQQKQNVIRQCSIYL